MSVEFRLFDFKIYNKLNDSDTSSSDEESIKYSKDKNLFEMQVFGLNEKGETCSIIVEGYKPFFYVKVGNNWTNANVKSFESFIKNKLGNYYKNSLTKCLLVKRKKLYGFDGGKLHKFVVLQFNNVQALNKAKYLWYNDDKSKLLKEGLNIQKTQTFLYESNIPPLLRYFHIQEISPSGWVQLPKGKYKKVKTNHKTSCKYEYIIKHNNLLPLSEKETPVPFKICSFDIEASSSHGDFPVPIKSYKKLAINIIELLQKEEYKNYTNDEMDELLYHILFTAFDLCDNPIDDIDKVYPISKNYQDDIESKIDKWLTKKLNIKVQTDLTNTMYNYNINNEDKDNDELNLKNKKLSVSAKNITVSSLLLSTNHSNDEKMVILDESLTKSFPKLEGDKVTFIGSTFMKYGEKEPYLNHCIALNDCDELSDSKKNVIDSYNTEKDVLLAWNKIIKQENPDIIIGYNIFGFDYDFMFKRSIETGCMSEFLELSRNLNEDCYSIKDNKPSIETSKIVIASGEHDLKYINMTGRLQIDLYNYLRRDYNLTSYKLDNVASEFIGDSVKSIEHNEDKKSNFTTKIISKNLTGLYVDGYVHFEESSHSIDYYKDGEKFKVIEINKGKGYFVVNGKEQFDMSKSVRWGLAKDDVTPKDIFRLTHGSSSDRAIIAKYCIQDCNLVHHLLNKIDVITGFIEMSKICSVPMSFLVLRGQGIKLTSFIAQKCREKNTLMPVIEKKENDDGYEGAIVLDPKCNLYLDDPVACVDYSSLYPSSMISENLCHSSKVWTKEYNLNNELVEELGEKNDNDEYIYDNLPEYTYVNVTYDTFKYVRKTEKSAAVKVKKGYKICRFAEHKDEKAILPSVLKELLASRKATKKLMAKETEPFMQNILDKRQLSIKLTANSLYGQCGARTSTFYEKDVAASTTATGRKLLTYGKRIIEEVYGDTLCETSSHGKIRTRAEYVYGDTDSVFFKFNPETLEGVPIKGKEALGITIELAQEAGELASKFLKNPHDLEYEKTFLPFCLLSKKRYVGMLYETDVNKCKQKSMGIVLKRRDNAPIVKDIYGGIIDILMKDKNIGLAMEFLKDSLQNLIDEKVPLEKLIITKSLRSGYKNPKQIAHKVLADRMGKRDPGNKPSSGDRIPFVYIKTKEKVELQGDKIETPNFIKENKIKPDYSFYITNQIMKPVQQVFALVLEDMPSIKNKPGKLKSMKLEINRYKKLYYDELEKYEKKKDDLRNKEVKKLLFDEYLININNKSNGDQYISSFFKNIR